MIFFPLNPQYTFRSVPHICSFTCTDTLYGKSLATDVDDILIINTYTEANPWSNDFITSIVNMASQNSHIGVYTAHMKC